MPAPLYARLEADDKNPRTSTARSQITTRINDHNVALTLARRPSGWYFLWANVAYITSEGPALSLADGLRIPIGKEREAIQVMTKALREAGIV